jgi:hypothetical protein
VQRLSIRRQGHGVALAVLQFVEVPLSDDTHVRIYTTDINADTNTRHQMAMVLLARSRLAVLMVGELPPHAMTTALKPLGEALAKNNWPNRDMLLLPLGSATTLAAQAAQLVGKSGVVARVTPQAARPTDAWAFISGAWNRLRGQVGGPATLSTELASALPKPAVPTPEAPTQAMELSPSPTSHHLPIVSPAAVRWADYALRCAAVKGVVSCCVFDLSSQRPLAHTGGSPPPERLAIQGALLLDAMADAVRQLGLAGTSPPEASISVGHQHLLLRPVPGHPGIVLHTVLHASASNLTLARMQLERVSTPV